MDMFVILGAVDRYQRAEQQLGAAVQISEVEMFLEGLVAVGQDERSVCSLLTQSIRCQ